MRTRTRLRRNSALLLLGWCASSFATESISVGPVDQLSPSQNELRVLGHTYKVSSVTEIDGIEGISGRLGQSFLQSLELGDHALVVGQVDASGQLVATKLRRLSTRYVPGASQVFARGKISKVDWANGSLNIGEMEVHISGIADLSALDIRPAVEIELVGIQPQPSGIVLALALVVVTDSATSDGLRLTGAASLSVTGTSKQSVTGTGIKSVTGTGSLSVTGTGRLSVTGTGKQSVTGTGVQSVTGTGSLSVTGTGKQSVTGTGIQSVTGTGSLSVTGTGKQSVTGKGIQSVTGTGSLSVTGTGKQSVTGTGIQSVTGTGKQSVTGTGSLSVTGTGKQSVTGTGSL